MLPKEAVRPSYWNDFKEATSTLQQDQAFLCMKDESSTNTKYSLTPRSCPNRDRQTDTSFFITFDG
ncbi:hypothetical protein CIPAW_11G125600 [Carya illinoinensis]|uniref:Uncharacterized protein n=1 Tax=Carya illinoinensis TaxID=32201 RepID=A0A8T1P480_CARIL|nr:hypothetical protein CIPAW_11G125600 [Carya illinoinensis]KAG6688427.1 hypothetical protein I3842_11G124600 [Carya illinoinensis]